MKIGNFVFDKATYVMSIINLTPDSFYEKSRATDDFKSAVSKHISDGADIIDIGAQSTRPGYTEVGADEEIKRLAPLWEIIGEISVPVSVDTYFTKTAEFALSHGADMINDVWGLKDNGMAECIAEFDAAVCIMHNQTGTEYESILDDMDAYFERALNKAIKAGIDSDRICIDVGICFGKTREQNFEVLDNLEHFHKFGYPMLLGTSRKSLYGGDISSRLVPTLETTAKAFMKGVRFVRVHDTYENKKVLEELGAKLY